MIEKFIPYGHENAVKYETLEKVTGLNRRQIRKAIADSKAIIMNMQDGKGFFRFDPHTKAERELAKKYSAQEKSRGWSNIRKAIAVDKRLKKTSSSEFNGNLYQMARLLVGISREFVAAQLGCSIRRIGRVENGEFDYTEDEKKKFEELVGFEL